MPTKKKKSKSKEKTFKCFECGRVLEESKFYKDPVSVNGHTCICKDCCVALVLDETNQFVVRDKMINLLRRLDRPFFQTTFIKFCETSDGYPTRIVGGYIGSINRGAFKEYTFMDSDFGDSPEVQKAYEEMGYEVDTSENDALKIDETDVGTQTGKKENSQYNKALSMTNARKNELQEKWGKFNSIDYLERCEKMYAEVVSGGYQIMSAMHEVSLKNAIKLQIEYDIAIETGQYEKMAKLSGQLKTARDEARLNPKQIKEDFQQGGFTTFGEMSLTVNQDRGNIYLDMKYIAKPHDDIDVLIFEYVNYCRHMFQMPEMVDYAELYAFFLNRVLEFTESDNPDDLERLRKNMQDHNLLQLAKEYHERKK